MKKIFLFNFIFLFISLNVFATQTPIPTTTPTSIPSNTYTATPTQTATSTNTLVPTYTYTMTVTQTPTIIFTPTVTPTSIPMYAYDKVFAYPNPAKGVVNIAYPILSGKVVTKVRVLLHSILGSKVAEVTESSILNGVVTFSIEKFPTGIYLYRVIVEYADRTEIRYDYDRLAIIK
ncbi:MAG: T9SS type A sorting domain-containing protein [Candidatus Goldbacteria bacterium]|nr:T9SS type A sorting domain-containing protein [Candidatus Goldiibacteriota bacterium]